MITEKERYNYSKKRDIITEKEGYNYRKRGI